MLKLFLFLSGVCLLYFILIVSYSGIGTSFCFIWLVFAVLFAVMGIQAHRALRDRGEMPRALTTFLFTSFVLALTVFIGLMGFIVREPITADFENADYCIVLGARVYDDGISKTLKYRLDKAAEYYESYPDTILVLSGGKASDDAVPEALAMYNYLILKGIPDDHMLFEPVATSTHDNIALSRNVINQHVALRQTPKGPGAAEWEKDRIPRVAVLTSNYHLMRAVSIAKTQQIGVVGSVSAPSDPVLFIHQCVRESAAVLKDYLVGNFVINE